MKTLAFIVIPNTISHPFIQVCHVAKASNCFNNIIIETENINAKQWVVTNGFTIVHRPVYDYSRFNYYLKEYPDYDVYVQLSTCFPFLCVKTIRDCVGFLKNSPTIDSVFTAIELQGKFWITNNPVNYNPYDKEEHTKTVIKEVPALYGVKRGSLEKYSNKIGVFPLTYIIDAKQASEIN